MGEILAILPRNYDITEIWNSVDLVKEILRVSCCIKEVLRESSSVTFETYKRLLLLDRSLKEIPVQWSRRSFSPSKIDV